MQASVLPCEWQHRLRSQDSGGSPYSGGVLTPRTGAQLWLTQESRWVSLSCRQWQGFSWRTRVSGLLLWAVLVLRLCTQDLVCQLHGGPGRHCCSSAGEPDLEPDRGGPSPSDCNTAPPAP
uniref:Uncharacterized protein n=1 Tax=Colobus angolensis palliatus TaxID=336983 RepID=A0A2K5I9E9_COLAP